MQVLRIESKTTSLDYKSLLDHVVESTIKTLCKEDDPRLMCNSKISSQVIKQGSKIGFEWTADNMPLLIESQDFPIFIRNLGAVPSNVVKCKSCHACQKHPYLDVWWMSEKKENLSLSCQDKPSLSLDASREMQDVLKMSKCEDHYTVDPSLSILDVWKHYPEHLAVFCQAFLTHHQTFSFRDTKVLEVVLCNADKLRSLDINKYKTVSTSSLNQALLVRSLGKSLIVQDFDLNYIVVIDCETNPSEVCQDYSCYEIEELIGFDNGPFKNFHWTS